MERPTTSNLACITEEQEDKLKLQHDGKNAVKSPCQVNVCDKIFETMSQYLNCIMYILLIIMEINDARAVG
jgi:hypothetical protein